MWGFIAIGVFLVAPISGLFLHTKIGATKVIDFGNQVILESIISQPDHHFLAHGCMNKNQRHHRALIQGLFC